MVYGGLPSQFMSSYRASDIVYFKNYEKADYGAGHYKSDHWKLAIDSATFGDSKIESAVTKVILDTGCTVH
jgi:hypothetical protein